MRMEDPFATPPTPPPGHPGARRFVKVAVGIVAIFALLLGGAGVYVYKHVNDRFRETHDREIQVDEKPGEGEAMNILVLGSDRRDVVDPADRGKRQFSGGSGRRADTIILLHVARDGKHAVLVHFPRDLRVRIPGRDGFSKINSAYQGGPNLMVRTVRQYTGLKIHHYVEVNFASFKRIVEAVGGVTIYVNRTYDDPQSGLRIDRPGCIAMDGDLALSYVRMRKQDPRGDFGRIERQQQFVRVLMDKVTSIGFILDIPRVLRLANAMSTGLVTDENLSLGIVRTVARKLAGFQQNLLDFRVVPSHGQTIGGVSYVVAEEEKARPLFAALAADKALPPFGKTPLSIPVAADVTVRVRNAAGVEGLAAREAQKLRTAGFVVRGVDTAPARAETTTIYFQPGTELKARLLGRRFPGAALRVAPAVFPTDLQVWLGSDVAGTTASPAPRASGAKRTPTGQAAC